MYKTKLANKQEKELNTIFQLDEEIKIAQDTTEQYIFTYWMTIMISLIKYKFAKGSVAVPQLINQIHIIQLLNLYIFSCL